jgi:hypothetical protein
VTVETDATPISVSSGIFTIPQDISFSFLLATLPLLNNMQK